MAPGYLIAVLCEAAGFAGLGVGLIVLRAQRLAKATELRSFLRSGRSAAAVPVTGAPALRRGRPVRPVARPQAPMLPRSRAVADSAARSALHRAVERR